MRRLSPLSAALALAAAVSSCSAPSLRVSPRIGQIEPTGGLIAVTAGDPELGTDLDALGLTEESIFLPRLDFEAGPFQWTLDYAGLDYSGQGETSAEIDLGGATISGNVQVATELDIQLYRSSFTWDVIPGDTVDLGIGFGLGAADFAASVTDIDPLTPGSDSGSVDQLVPLPYAAGSATIEIGPVGLEGLVGYFSLDLDDVEVSYLDIDANAYWQFVDAAGAGIRAVVGMRIIELAAAFDDGDDRIDADQEFSGPYAGLTIVI